MNDRASAAPPADFLGPGAESTAEYERQFAMDWKPPDLELAHAAPAPAAAGFGGYGGGHGDVLGSRASFSSVRSGASAFTNAAGRSGGNGNNNNKAPRQATSGFFAQVKERFGLARSNSSMDVVPRLNSDGVHELDDGSTGGSGFFVPPVFKHKRSESVGANNLHKKPSEPRQQHAGGFFSAANNNTTTKDGSDGAHNLHKLTKSATNTAIGHPHPHASMPHVGAIPSLPGFDPTKRPSRDEIAANYQSLLASGFFGTHAIQSTRFAPPGQNLHRQDNGPANNKKNTDSDSDNNNTTNMPSFAQRLAEQDESRHEDATFPPSPDRLPPPPPPNRAAPPPPPPPAPSAMEVEMEDVAEPAPAPTPAGIPASNTAVFNPVAPAATPAPRSSFSSLIRGAHTTTPSTSTNMPPPPPSLTNITSSTANATKGRKLKSAHKPSLAFSSVPYSSTEPGAEPLKAAQPPVRASPFSIARFSTDTGRPRSFDAAFLQHQQQQNQRGVKRPFTATNNDSRASLATTTGCGAGAGRGSFEDRYDYNYDYEHDGVGIGIGVATTTTPAEEKQESGARKLVKRLRKSASKISIDLGRTISRQSLSSRPGDQGDGHHQHHLGSSLDLPPSRTSTSSSFRESLSWRLGVSSSSPGGGSSSLFGGIGGGGGGGGGSSSSSNSSNNGFGDSYFSLSSTHSNSEPQHHYQPHAAAAATTPTARAVPDPPAREAPTPPTTSTSPPTFALVTASLLSPDPSSVERNRLKKREIRGRRLRRQGSSSGNIHHKSPTKPSPLNQPPMVSPPPAPALAPSSLVTTEGSSSSGGGAGMDWQSSPTRRGRSRSRSRPRRSETSLFMLSSTTSTSPSKSSSPRRMAQDGGDGFGGERGTTVRLLPQRQLFGAGSQNNNNNSSASLASSSPGEGGVSSGMEGVEFSFHFPGRMRPGGGGGAAAASGMSGGSGPLAVVPDANRGIPSVPSIPGVFRKGVGGGFGSVRVVRSDLV